MEAKDFRIGNKVYYLAEPGIKLICTLDGEDIKLISEKLSYLEVHEPIPLNDEILLNCNLEKDNGYPYKFAQGYIEKHENGFFFHYHNIAIRLYYVHHMQNLYFALTGKELEVKL